MKVLSIDIFQTLVDMHPHKTSLWEIILGESYDPDLARQGWHSTTVNIFDILTNMENIGIFQPLEKVFETAYSRVFYEYKINYSPLKASRALKQIHKDSIIYDDALKFIENMNKKYTICISSDTDNDMLEKIQGYFTYDKLYTSENLRTYKIWRGNNFFSSIINDYSINKSDLLHIGDSSSDIIGANSAGVKVCWLNRNKTNWIFDGKPDFSVNNLTELGRIL